MENLIPWGLSVVQWVQSFRNPILDSFFLTVNYLGEAYFFLAFIPLFYWCINKHFAYRFAFLLGFSTYLNLVLKDFFATPRPYEIDPKLYLPGKETTHGIPSFHAQQSTLTWGYIAMQFGRAPLKPLLWALAVALPLLVSIGRMYVGVHFPQDVIFGAALGAILFFGFAAYEPHFGEWLKSHTSLVAKLTLAVIVPIALAAAHFDLETATELGTLMGFAIGLVLEEEYVRFDARGELWKQFAKFLIGAIVLLALQQGSKALLGESPIINFVRYTIVGFWLGLGAPLVFVRARLASIEK